jgi:predicted lipoprotein
MTPQDIPHDENRRQWLRLGGLAPLALLSLVAPPAALLPMAALAATPASPKRPPHDPKVAAPFVTPSQFVRGALALHFVPAAGAFEQSSAALAAHLAGACRTAEGLQAARALWRTAMLDWERLAAVAVGPLIDHRAARTLDFWPTRPPMIEAAVRAQPTGLTALERVGAPAKGLPALEWLLWQPRMDDAQCAYAALLARECEAQAQALRAGFDALAQKDWDDESALPVLHDWIGQAVGGLEQLRWKKIGKPARSGRKGDWPRAASGQTRAAWQAHWEGLEQILLGTVKGEEQGSLNGLLRGRGYLGVSGQLERAAAGAAAAVAAADPARPATLAAAQQALARTKAVIEDQAAEALQITVGFSDADGD